MSIKTNQDRPAAKVLYNAGLELLQHMNAHPPIGAGGYEIPRELAVRFDKAMASTTPDCDNEPDWMALAKDSQIDAEEEAENE